MSTRIVEVRAKVLKQNDLLARSLRQRFQASGTCVVGLVSSPGSGKTAFLEKVLGGLAREYRVTALVGDLATENDAARLKRATPKVRLITTGTICHLDAQMIEKALEGWQLDQIDFLFIENVANLVCPSSYDLGEELRFVLLSATEGKDKPLKYPNIFQQLRCRDYHQNGYGRRCRFRSGCGAAEYSERAPRYADIGGFVQNGRGYAARDGVASRSAQSLARDRHGSGCITALCLQQCGSATGRAATCHDCQSRAQPGYRMA
jgi:hydrogenase accessory protein HypB